METGSFSTRSLDLKNTKATDAGVAKLQKGIAELQD
jgi:hypothetical protein